MTVTGFDRDIAEANGYDIVLRDGLETAVRDGESALAASGPEPDAEPHNTLYGNCGYSWFYITTSFSGLQYGYYTGFHVNAPAVEYDWHLNIAGPWSYERDFYHGGLLAFRSDWEHTAGPIAVDDAGNYSGQVVPLSVAYLANGGYCTSAQPSDTGWVG